MEGVFKMIIIWGCRNCGSIQVSNSKLRHTMDTCECGKISLDLEEYGCRIVGSFKDYVKLKKIKHTQYDIWQELTLGSIEQDYTEKIIITWIMGQIFTHKFKNSKDYPLLKDIEKEVYLSFI